jgi:hypothetical protein
MPKNSGLLAILVVVGLISTGGIAVPSLGTSAPDPAETAVLSSSATDTSAAAECGGDSLNATDESLTLVPPGCCTTQCNVDKDCNKICGKGNCVCLQQTSCCRRCVY